MPTNTKNPKPTTTPPTDWQFVAETQALLTHADAVGRSRGVMPCSPGDSVLVYSTHPYVGHPTLRDEEWALLRRWLTRRGIVELAFATYPAKPTCTGQAQVMLVAAGDKQMQAVEDEWARLHEYSLDRIWAQYVSIPGRPLGRPA